ncbi:MAG: aminotransferase class III-fold pyridoxal phosphate-dependent enzyme [Gemmatimonadota bacterium]|nr:aminotransferase class III-fold pyridoxal phosphate-dependent enzyme [Gemmatimonadota bacterium]
MNSRIHRAAAVARDHFGVGGEARPLPGEVDLNFRVSDAGGDIVLKLGRVSRLPVFDLVTSCLYHLAAGKFPGRVPRVVAPVGTAASTRVAHVTFEGAPHVACAVTWLHGIPLAELRPRSPAVLEDLGALLAELDTALADFDHPELERDFAWRMESAAATIRGHLDRLGHGQDLVERTLDRAAPRLDAVADELPRAVIHNDGNDFNVLVRPSLEGARLAGLIDFGDVARGWRAAEVAIAAAYAMMGGADPLGAACAIARGYAGVAPLTAEECRAILPMVALRLCQSVSVQARQMREQPGNEYLAVSQEAAWRLLDLLARTDWRIGESRIRHACGLDPNPGVAPVAAWMRSAGARAPVMPRWVLARPRVLDLSVESPDLPHPDDAARPGAAEAWIEREIADAAATVAVGRYGEARLLYDTPAFQARGDNGPESRTVHLGLDLFAPAGTPVRAPIAGFVLAVAHNDRPLDYGPTVILRHATPDGAGFHTLYGHLDRATLGHLSPGDRVAPGDVIGWLGDASVNGGWPPHLHLQVIAMDPLFDEGTPPEDRGNYTGVVLHRLRAVWESILPDPAPLAGLPSGTRTAIAPETEPVLRKRVLSEKRKTILGSSLSLSYADPIHVVRGVGAYLYDDTGRRYLDTVNNVPHVGHGNPRVAEAIARQSRVLNTNTRYLHTEIVALGEELLAHFPAPLEVMFLVCSGSEANELALRMARCRTGHDGVVCVEGGYHGNTGGLVEISHYKFAGPGGTGASDRVVAAAMPDVYRGRLRRGRGIPDGELGVRYAAEVGDAARVLGDRGHGVAAFVAEPILSCGGQIEPPPGYLEAAYRHVRAAGGVCVADEVQVGFGRVGDAFWGFELQGVVPDIVTLGKPMGNGHPVAAVVTTREIADAFANGMEYFSTFGGNPVSCAAARAVLAEIGERGLVEHARRVGAGLLERLGELAARHPLVGDVRGRGLFLGIEIVRDRETREPYPEACAYIVNRARAMGVLLSADGPGHNVLKVKPPMVFGEDDAEWLVETLNAILGESALCG